MQLLAGRQRPAAAVVRVVALRRFVLANIGSQRRVLRNVVRVRLNLYFDRQNVRRSRQTELEISTLQQVRAVDAGQRDGGIATVAALAVRRVAPCRWRAKLTAQRVAAALVRQLPVRDVQLVGYFGVARRLAGDRQTAGAACAA